MEPMGQPQSAYVCVCVCTCTCMFACMGTHMHECACAHTCMHACACMCLHACICVHVGGQSYTLKAPSCFVPTPPPAHTADLSPTLELPQCTVPGTSSHPGMSSHPATSDSSPPAPPAPSPAAGGPSLGTLGPVQALGLRSLGSLEPDGQLLEPLGVLQLCHLDLGETPGASLPTPGWAAQRPRAYRWPSPGPAGGLGVLYTCLTSGPCLGWNPAHRPPK